MAAAMFVYGRVNLRLNNPHMVEEEVGTFYLANKELTMFAVRQAIERREPDIRLADPRVGQEFQDGYLLVPVIFHSKLGYQYFSCISKGDYLKEKMKEEFGKIGYKEPFNVGVEKWELPERPKPQNKVVKWLTTLPQQNMMYEPSQTASVADPWDILGCSPVRAGDDSNTSAMLANSGRAAPPVATVNPSPRPNNTLGPLDIEWEEEDNNKETNTESTY
ncbi:PREDICTED: uncharacterized protein LOC109472692 [Branchiostoma belcheri]|uniref:Uncharacterized protein LOC109472692 n=1 Tax=Branchiostoma belcheri TaxID=7741 RepID=A0A6P4YUT7_BRABE|nr:PREDICTED: uncharacterized protein LOC109472692 [Branchiostoma belcheri]